MPIGVEKLKSMALPRGMDFHIRKVGREVLQFANLERSTGFYTKVIAFDVSDVYPEDMMPVGMVFLHCNAEHHYLAFVGAGVDQVGTEERVLPSSEWRGAKLLNETIANPVSRQDIHLSR